MARAAESQKRPPEILSEVEVRALIRACSNRAPTGIRNRALIAVMWRCGLRISEALALEPRDVDLASISHGWFEGGLLGGHGNVLLSREDAVYQDLQPLLRRSHRGGEASQGVRIDGSGGR